MTRPCATRHPDPAATSATCRLCWLARHDASYRALWGVPGPAEPVPPGGEWPAAPPASPAAAPGVARPVRCEHLGRRVELRAGCGGWNCRHDCELGLPAVPGGYCQTCPQYSPCPDAADDFARRGAVNWLG